MPLHAIDDISDAFGATAAFLFPFDTRRWAKLAVVSLFVGGGLSLPTFQANASGGLDEPIGTGAPGFPPDALGIVVAIVAAVVLVGVAYSVVGAIMEFVFVESLRTEAVTIRRHWGRRWRQGLRLFGFRIAIGLPVLALVAGWIGLLAAPALLEGVDPLVPVGALFVFGLPLVLLVGLLYALVASLTTVFVVPIMIETDGGVLAAWRRLWASIKTHPRQYLACVAVGFVLTVATGVLASIVVSVAAVVFLLPLGIVVVPVVFVFSLSSTAALVVLGAAGALFVVWLLVVWLFVQVPVVTYLRYYALLVLGDLEASLDLVSGRRAAIRA
ncbi:uncharacterized protein Nmlp_1233 [Natronomonas moolapensis 8.8.11]|uniref:Uncharacterized protein n=2 Tax=Halobacteriales TaxID=2235 RepID=M1XK85_NATM8|nr:hypothetical protein [Natronomonas moolapensis]CCQ35442.1 uncharacterized protein Nmlp_1233 [Natronomonas moolapensis 8.8.11]